MAAHSTPAVRLLLAVLLVGGVSGVVYLAVRPGGDGDKSQVAGKLTVTATVVATNTPPQPMTSVPAPTSTANATLEPATVPPLAPATPDTRVPMGLPRADQIQVGKDGKYFVADRGDGCMWLEHSRETNPVIGLQVFLGTDCPADFAVTFRPATREVIPLVP
jgi:hypothetical protein